MSWSHQNTINMLLDKTAIWSPSTIKWTLKQTLRKLLKWKIVKRVRTITLYGFQGKKNVFPTYSCWLHCLVQFPLGPLHYKPTSCKFHHLMPTSLHVAPFLSFVIGLLVFFTVRPLKPKIKTVECLKPRISNIIEYRSIINLAKSYNCAVFCCWVVF